VRCDSSVRVYHFEIRNYYFTKMGGSKLNEGREKCLRVHRGRKQLRQSRGGIGLSAHCRSFILSRNTIRSFMKAGREETLILTSSSTQS